VSLFVLSPEIEDRGEVEVATGSKSVLTPVTKKKPLQPFLQRCTKAPFSTE
jgi:hypothetical protein